MTNVSLRITRGSRQVSIRFVELLDSGRMARARRRELQIPRERARELGLTAVSASRNGSYKTTEGKLVELGDLVAAARAAKVSIPPETALPARPHPASPRDAGPGG